VGSDREGGNTLVLFPAAVLIVLGLGALALDSATLFLGQRRLADLAAAIANDAAAGIDLASFYDPDEEFRLDAARAATRSAQLVRGRPLDRSFEAVRCEVATVGLEATVTCSAEVRPLFAPVWPGLSPLQRIQARETAVGIPGLPQ
jgi:hypothetical protein